MLFPAFLQVNDDWILRRLEKWGRREGMPFLGPQKAVILQQLVQEQQPQLAVEVGSMAGYSAIVIAQVCTEGGWWGAGGQKVGGWGGGGLWVCGAGGKETTWGQRRYKNLRQLMRDLQLQMAVEVGSMAGYSAIVTAQVWFQCVEGPPPGEGESWGTQTIFREGERGGRGRGGDPGSTGEAMGVLRRETRHQVEKKKINSNK